jgi:hypothetical protein
MCNFNNDFVQGKMLQLKNKTYQGHNDVSVLRIATFHNRHLLFGIVLPENTNKKKYSQWHYNTKQKLLKVSAHMCLKHDNTEKSHYCYEEQKFEP